MPKDDGESIYIKLLYNTIKGVIVGVKTPPEATKIIKQDCKKEPNCFFYHLNYVNGEYMLSDDFFY